MSSTFWYFVGGAAMGLVIPPILLILGLNSLVKRVKKSQGGKQLPPPPLPARQQPEADYTLALRYLDGEEASLDEWRGEVLVLNFWATWCPGCVLELPHLNELASQEGVEVLCISDEPVPTLQKFLEGRPELKDLPVFSRASDTLPAVYKAQGIPYTCIVSAEGKIIFSHCGAADWAHKSVLDFLRGTQTPAAELVECNDGICPIPAEPRAE